MIDNFFYRIIGNFLVVYLGNGLSCLPECWEGGGGGVVEIILHGISLIVSLASCSLKTNKKTT